MYIPRAPTFYPFPVGPPVGGYQAWYDASDVSSLTRAGDDVTGWADKSEMGNDLSFVTTAPTYTSRSINAITCVEFTTASRMDSAQGVSSTSDSSATWFHVALLDTTAAVRVLAGHSGSDGLLFYVNGSNQLVADINRSSGIIGPTTATVSLGVAFQSTLVLSTGSNILRLNAVEATSATGFSFTAGTTLRLGCYLSGVDIWDGLIGEIIYYPSVLSSPDRLLVEAYLKSKWGTP